MEIDNRPLVSFCVKCYNQERYIGKALDFAFAQTYDPLEILICDDASQDSSDLIIKAKINEYLRTGGRHSVRYYRNEHNLGNLGNWQRMCELAEGELLIKADGDDFSTFDRTEKLVSAWMKDGRRATLILSDGWAIDCKNDVLWAVDMSAEFCIGAFEAYSKECCTTYPTTENELGHDAADDVVYVNCAKMLGGTVLHVPERLVYYRQGSGETSSGVNYVKMQTRGFLFMLASAEQLILDLESIKQRLSESRYQEYKNQFDRSLKHHQALRELWLGCSFAGRKRGYDTLMELHSYDPNLGKFMLLPHWISHVTLNMLFALNYRLKSWKRAGH